MPTADVLLGGDCTGSKTYGLSFIAGYVDTAVFVGLFGLFTAHVTGNFVLIGSELVHRRPDVWPKLLAFPVFVVAVAAAVKIVETLERRRTAAVPMLLWSRAMGAVLRAAPWCSGIRRDPATRRRSSPACWPPARWESRTR